MASRTTENDSFPRRPENDSFENDFGSQQKPLSPTTVAKIAEAVDRATSGELSHQDDSRLLSLAARNTGALPPKLRKKVHDLKDKRRRPENDRLAAKNENDNHKMAPALGGLGGSRNRPARTPEQIRASQTVTAANLVAEAKSGIFDRKPVQQSDKWQSGNLHWTTDAKTGAQYREYADQAGKTVKETRSTEAAVTAGVKTSVSRAAALIFMERGVVGQVRADLVKRTYARAVDLVDSDRPVDLNALAQSGNDERARTENAVVAETVRVLQQDRRDVREGRPVGKTVDLADLQKAFEAAADAIVEERGADPEIKARYQQYFVNSRNAKATSAEEALKASEQPGYAPTAATLQVTTLELTRVRSLEPQTVGR